jgi:hypothetical protein
MVDLSVAVEDAVPNFYAAIPLLGFKLRIDCATNATIQNIALRCQIRIEPTQRRYEGNEPERLRDLFGERDLWSRSLRSMLWTHASVVVPPFTGSAVVELPVACSFDFNLAATKYFDALEAGDVPLCFLFSGTVFYEGAEGRLQIAQIGWDKEANFRLGIGVWKEMMDHYYPNSAWLCVRKDVFDRLHQFKREHALTNWEEALETLLASAGTYAEGQP